MITVNNMLLSTYLGSQKSIEIQQELGTCNKQHNFYRQPCTKVIPRYKRAKIKVMSTKEEIFAYFLSSINLKINKRFHRTSKVKQQKIINEWNNTAVNNSVDATILLESLIIKITKR